MAVLTVLAMTVALGVPGALVQADAEDPTSSDGVSLQAGPVLLAASAGEDGVAARIDAPVETIDGLLAPRQATTSSPDPDGPAEAEPDAPAEEEPAWPEDAAWLAVDDALDDVSDMEAAMSGPDADDASEPSEPDGPRPADDPAPHDEDAPSSGSGLPGGLVPSIPSVPPIDVPAGRVPDIVSPLLDAPLQLLAPPAAVSKDAAAAPLPPPHSVHVAVTEIAASPQVHAGAFAAAVLLQTVPLVAADRFRFLRPLLLLPLYARIPRDELLEHPLRSRIYAALQESPGLSIEDLAGRTGLSRSAVRHHVRALGEAGLVGHDRLGRERIHFPAGGKAPAVAQRLTADPVRATLVERLAKGPAALSELAACIDASPSRTHFHLRRLCAAGLVTVEPRPRRYRLMDAAQA